MGKIFNALERHKKESSVMTENLVNNHSEGLTPHENELTLAKKITRESNYDHKLVTLSAPESVDAENFKLLRAKILFPKNGSRPGTIMITSTFPGEGKTFIAANLAVSIALGINEHVLLVDCDLRRPSLHNILGYSNKEGLHEYLTGKKQLADLIIRTKVEKLSFLTAGSSPSNPSELLSSAMMKDFISKTARGNQDRFVIIDAPPAQITSETGVLSNYVDGIIFVIMAGVAPRQTIQKTLETFGKKKVLGIVFNGYTKSYKSYHKYYGNYYSSK